MNSSTPNNIDQMWELKKVKTKKSKKSNYKKPKH